MKRVAIVSRWLVRALAWLVASVFLLVVLWYAANRILDPELDDSFISSRNVPDGQNAAIAILGLTAPSGTDFRAYGLKVKALYEGNAPRDRILDALKGAKTLQPTAESEHSNCWLDPHWPVSDKCPSFEAGREVVRANEELLRRLRQTHSFESYAGNPWQLNSVYLTLTKLSIADMQWDLRQGAHESAYRKWRAQLRFVRMTVRGTDTWVGRTVGLVAMGLTMPVLENLLDADPNIARRHATELLTLLRPGGVAAFEPEGIVRGEYVALRRWLQNLGKEEPDDDQIGRLVALFGQKNRILNRYARFAPDHARAMQSRWSELPKAYEQVRETHYGPEFWEFILDPVGSVFLADQVDSQLQIRELVRQMHYFDGRLRLATLGIQQINAAVPDAGMAEFLAAAGRELWDPFSGRPMQWDPKDRKIYMTDPDERCLVMAWFRLPAPRGTQRPSGSAVGTNAC